MTPNYSFYLLSTINAHTSPLMKRPTFLGIIFMPRNSHFTFAAIILTYSRTKNIN